MGGMISVRMFNWRGSAAVIAIGACALAACGSDTTTTSPSTSDESRSAVVDTTTAATAAPAATTAPSSSTAIDSDNADTVTSTSVSGESAAGLLLEADGLGVVAFGTDHETTVATLTAAIGAPSTVQAPFQDTGNTSRAAANWDGLVVSFSGPVDGPLAFSGYEFGRVHTADASGTLTEGAAWDATGWQAATATADGVAPGTPVIDAAEVHTTVYLPDCGRALQPSSLLGGAGSPGQMLFLEPIETGLFVRAATDGTIFSVGAQAAPNTLACDGG